MDINFPLESIDRISTGRISEEISMSTQIVGNKAKAFAPRNLVLFFLITFEFPSDHPAVFLPPAKLEQINASVFPSPELSREKLEYQHPEVKNVWY